MTREFSAPLCRAVRFTTVLSVLLLCVMPSLGARFGPHQWPLWRVISVLLPIFAVVAGVLFMVRGYRIGATAIEIERFGWSTQLPLAGLRAAGCDPLAFAGSTRRGGNGGFFAITGAFSSPRHGRMRAWATDPARAVALKFADRTVILTPDDPARFVQELRHVTGVPALAQSAGVAGGK